MSRVACIGAGIIGRAWAVRFAAAGHRVVLYDTSRDALQGALAAIDTSLADLENAGIVENAAYARSLIVPSTRLERALEGVAYVQENVSEDVRLKQEVFSALDNQAPEDAVLASSTSEIVGSQIFSHLSGRSRCLVAHPLNPPSLLPLVELCASPWTSEETMRRARTFLKASGLSPILVRKEISGFVANRLQLAVLGEALHLVGEGYCSVEDLDAAMKNGLALRWSIIGPFETGHLNASQGYRSYLDAFAHTHRKIIADLDVAYEWDDELINHVHDELAQKTPAEGVPARQAWRDRRLISLIKHLLEDRELD